MLKKSSTGKDVVKCLNTVFICTHGGRRGKYWVCNLNLTDVIEKYKRVALQKSIVVKFLRSLVRNGPDAALFTR